MKKKLLLFILVLSVFMLSACGMRELEQRLDIVEYKIDMTEDRLENAVESAIEPERKAPVKKEAAKKEQAQKEPVKQEAVRKEAALPEAEISLNEAEAIALEHAGLNSDEVSALRVKADYDDGRVEYDVSFRKGFWEYDYEINAQSGEIISFEIDD